ncbi:unnamed protein product [Prunus armeniaca]
MASSSSIDFPSIHHVISIHLERDNYPMWLAQIVHVLCSHRLLDFVDDTSLFLTTVAPKSTAHDTWVALENSFASPNQNLLLQLRSDLLRTTHGDSSITDFLDRIKSIVDNLALVRASVADSDLFAVIMNNVGPLYENNVAFTQAREKPISMPDLEALLLSAECHLQSSSSLVIFSGATTLIASCGGCSGRGGCGFGHRGGFASSGLDRRSLFSPSRPGFSSGPYSLGASYDASHPASHPQHFGSTFGRVHIVAVCPYKTSYVPPPPSCLQGMTTNFLCMVAINSGSLILERTLILPTIGATYPLLESIMVMIMLEVYLVEQAHAALAFALDHSSLLDLPIIFCGPSLSSCSPRLPASQPLPSPSSPAPDLLVSTATHASSPVQSIYVITHAAPALAPTSPAVPTDPSCLSHPLVSHPVPSASRFSQTYTRNPNHKLFFLPLAHVSYGTSSSPIFDTSLVSDSHAHSMVTHAQTGICKPNPKYANHALVLSSTNGTFEPTSFPQANKHQEWRLAMADEFNAFLHAETWNLVPLTPTMNVLLNKWVFRVKRNSDGSIQHYKPCLVANGFHQQPGLDCGETFSPVVNHSTIRLILALSMQFGWIVHQLDVERCFFAFQTCGRRLSLSNGNPLSDLTEYRSIVGALQYLTLTHPNISFAVNQVCQFMHQPTTVRWLTVKRILRYLNGTLTHGLLYSPSTLHLSAYSDAYYVRDLDERRSTGSHCLYLGTNLISWSSKKQLGVSRSSTKSEYRQLAYTTVTLSCALSFASNPVFHSYTHHVEVDYHFVRENAVHNELLVAYCSTVDQIADIFTKGLSPAWFSFLQSKLPVLPRPVSLRGCNET